MVVGGDFNATPDTAQFRDVLAAGYDDAADQAGAGLTRTYPSDRWFPPLIAIDHVLCRGAATAVRASTVEIDGSDHRALLVHLRLARSHREQHLDLTSNEEGRWLSIQRTTSRAGTRRRFHAFA